MSTRRGVFPLLLLFLGISLLPAAAQSAPVYNPIGFNAVRLELFPNPVVGGQAAIGQLTLAQPAGAGGVVVSLASSNPAAAVVPASVTVPTGATGTTFPIITFPVATPAYAGISFPIPGGVVTVALQVMPGGSSSPFVNLLVNGSFEDPRGSPHGLRNLPGWRMLRGTVDILQEPNWQAAHGQQMIDLVGTPGAATIEQSFATEPGREYVFSGWIARNVEVSEGRANVYLNGQFFVQLYHREPHVTHRDMRWVPFAYRFRAAAFTTTLTLEDVTNLWDGGGGIFLDGLVVAPVDPPVPPTPLASPTNLVATVVSREQINLSWTDNSHNETGFALFRRAGGGAWERIALLGANITRFADWVVQPGILYTYRVQAVREAEVSGWSNEAHAGAGLPSPPVHIVPAPPTDLTAERVFATRIDLRWRDNSDNEHHFILWRRSGSGEFVRIGHVGANVTTYSDTGLQPHTTYSYFVRSWNPAGPSSRSNEVTVRTPAPEPGAPLNSPAALSATAVSASQIRLTWIDDVEGEAVFIVYRKGPVSPDFVKHADVPANRTSYLDQGLAPGTTYTYHVRAWHPDRDVSRRSNEASVTTPLAQ